MRQCAPHPVSAIFKLVEQLRNIGVVDGTSAGIVQQVLLADIGDVRAIVAFREQVIERLIAVRADVLRDGFVPFLRIGKDWVDIEDYAAEIEHAVLYNRANTELGAGIARYFDSASRLRGEEF